MMRSDRKHKARARNQREASECQATAAPAPYAASAAQKDLGRPEANQGEKSWYQHRAKKAHSATGVQVLRSGACGSWTRLPRFSVQPDKEGPTNAPTIWNLNCTEKSARAETRFNHERGLSDVDNTAMICCQVKVSQQVHKQLAPEGGCR